MKILFDNQCFYLHGTSGVSRYVANLIFALKQLNEHEILFVPSPEYDFFIHNKKIKNRRIKGLDRLRLEYRRKKDQDFIRKHIDTADWYLPTYYHPGFLPFTGKAKTGLIIHDLIHEMVPDQTKNPALHTSWKRSFIQKAALFFAVSKNTLNDLNAVYDWTIDKTTVIYPGKVFSDLTETKIDVPNSYVVYVGSRARYKNFEMLLNAEIFDVIQHLVCVGGGDFTRTEKELMKKAGITDRVFHYRPNQAELKYIYQHAQAYVSTSKYEGFGLPVLEALENGLQVLLWKSNVYQEITDGKAAYFDSVPTLIQAFENLRDQNIPIQQFDWMETAKRLSNELAEYRP